MLLLVALAAACGGRAVYHRVRPGETLYWIGKAYGVPYEEIARANKLRDPSRIRAGQRLLVPGADEPIEVALVAPRSKAGAPPRARHRKRPKGAPDLQWPVGRGTVTSGYGPRHGRFHDGIDIAAPVGAPVQAAAAGQVAYSSTLTGYGNVIIVHHGRGFATVYAHNRRNHVRAGERVRRGQLIATVGRTGRTTGPNLHFEVRRDSVVYDPLLFLPRRQ